MKKYSNELVGDVRALRARGLTYSEINNRLGLHIPKATLSYLCKGVDPGGMYRLRMEAESEQRLMYIRRLAVEKNKDLQAQRLTALRSNLGYVSGLAEDKLVQKVALAMLYLGEGSKWRSRRGPQLGSSDARIVRIYLSLIRKCYGISGKSIRCRIQYRADQDYAELLKYWQSVTCLPKAQFYPGYIDRRTIGKVTRRPNYRGVCTITSPGTQMQLELDIIADIIDEVLGH